MTMTKIALFIAMAGILFSHLLKADFFVYQEWTNPRTGQVLKEYYDVHRSYDFEVMLQQQEDFMAQAQSYGDKGLCLIEDMPSRALNKDISEHSFNAFFREYIYDSNHYWHLPIEAAPEYTSLMYLYTRCKIKDIPAINVECRSFEGHDADEFKENELAFYDDGPVLNEYYKLLSSPDDPGTERLCVDAKVLHILHTNPDKKFFNFAAGSLHITGVNIMLKKLGWIPTVPLCHVNVLTLRSYLFDPYANISESSTIEQIKSALVKLWNDAFTGDKGRFNFLAQYPIDISAAIKASQSSSSSSSSRQPGVAGSFEGIAPGVGAKPGSSSRPVAQLRSRL